MTIETSVLDHEGRIKRDAPLCSCKRPVHILTPFLKAGTMKGIKKHYDVRSFVGF